MADPRIQIPGQKMHRDLERGFSFCRPIHWNQYEMEDPYGVIYYPEDDPRTGFCVIVQDLGEGLDQAITEADLPDLRDGVWDGLRSLPDCEVLSEVEIAKESAIGFEFLYTFSTDGERYKRCMRLLYKDCQQFTIYGRGVPPEEYDVFANIFDWMYLTLTFGDLLKTLMARYPDLPPA